MVNPTIEEAGHYNPQAGKCPVCRVWWGMHSIEEENDHAMKILDWLEKKEIAQKIFEKIDPGQSLGPVRPPRWPEDIVNHLLPPKGAS